MKETLGKLYLIPTLLGENPSFDVLPSAIKEVIDRIDHFIVENDKTARAFIKYIHPEKKQSDLKLKVLNKFTTEEEKNQFLDECKTGISVGLLSEAGCPAIADPGSDIVKHAHKNNIEVIPLVGPSSIVLALMGSGMNGQSFAFNGYLPIDKDAKKSELRRLERLSFEHNQTQLFIETPYRNNKLLEDLCTVLQPSTRLCVACDLTLKTQYLKTYTIKEWKHIKIDLHKRPTIFVIHKD